MKIDSHQHFWHSNPVDYGWISDAMEILRKDHLPKPLNSGMKIRAWFPDY